MIKKNKLLILGSSGVGMIAASIAEKYYDYEIIGFLNDNLSGSVGLNKNYEYLGKLDMINKYINKSEINFFNGIIEYKKKIKNLNFKTAEIIQKKTVSLIHPSSNFYEKNIKLGKNILISSNVNISTDVIIEDNCYLMSNVFVGHNTTIKENNFIAASAVIGGNITINKNCFIGLNSTIIENCIIGENSIIGANCLIVKNLPKSSLVKGKPSF